MWCRLDYLVPHGKRWYVSLDTHFPVTSPERRTSERKGLLRISWIGIGWYLPFVPLSYLGGVSNITLNRLIVILLCLFAWPGHREKILEGWRGIFFLGRTVRADIFGRIYLGSKKFSQMAAFVGKSKNIESSLNLNNYCQISIQLACLT